MRFVTRMASRTALGAAAALGVGLSVLPARRDMLSRSRKRGKTSSRPEVEAST
jgi:hypothetical protein